jgi:hypothetical protein
MSQSLILNMMEEGQIFDAGRMRQWLDTRRSIEAVPSIAQGEAITIR